MKKEKLYNASEVSSFAMFFGINMCSRSKYPEKKKYSYKDKRTKEYGAQRLELLKNSKTNSRIKIK